MQEVFKKIIEKLKEEQNKSDEKCKYIAVKDGHSLEYEFYNGKSTAYSYAIETIKQVADEYNNGWIPADEPPKDDNYVLLSFENFSLPMVGRYEADGDGGGTYYIGDCDGTDTCIANDLIVDAWQPLPTRYNPDEQKKEKKTKYDQIRSMCIDEMASFLSEVKADGIYFKEGMEYPIISEVWKEWLKSEAESEKYDCMV